MSFDPFDPFGVVAKAAMAKASIEHSSYAKPHRLVFTKLPVAEIHQSWISTFRQCKKKAWLSSQLASGPSPYYMYMGSVFHAAFEHAVRSESIERWHKAANDINYWREVFSHVKQKPADFNDVDTARRMVKEYSGTNIPLIIVQIIRLLRGSGFEFIGVEEKLRYDPGYGGKPFVGTLDLRLRRNKKIIIVDTKTSGLWNIMKDKSPSKESYSQDQIRQHLQLRHYHWLGVKAGTFTVDEVVGYGIFCPTNLTKYVKGDKIGQFKGAPIFWGDVKPSFVERYEDDLVEWLNDAERGSWPRYYPGTFGKIECVRCPFNQTCLGDELSEATPGQGYVADGEEDLY